MGHRPTEVVDGALDTILHGGDYAEILSSLSPTELELFNGLIEEIHSTGSLDALDDLWRVDYVRRPPTIEEFLQDDYWLGQRTRPSNESEGVYPGWKEILIRDFNLGSQIHNTVISGSLGIGKSFIGCIILLYRLVLARLLRSPSTQFGMTKGSQIYYSILSITRAAVRETVFSDAIGFMSNSPFFLEECGFDPNKKYSDSLVPLGNSIYLNAGSKNWHVIGKNMMGVFLDEGNFRLEKNPNVQAYKLYSNVRARISNRFQRFKGFLPAISILASSAADESSFTEKVKKEIKEADDPRKQTIYQFAVYEIKRHVLRLSSEWFKVSYGLKNEDPRILSGWYTESGDPIEDKGPHETPSHGAQTVLVPKDYFDGFRRDVRQFLMDIAGVSVGGSLRLFPSTLDLEKCIELGEKDQIVNPCKAKFVPLSMEDGTELHEYLNHSDFIVRRASQNVPIRHPSAPRYVHLDLATTTKAGLSIGHFVGRQKVVEYRMGETFENYKMVFEYDFIITIVAGTRSPICLGKIENFIFWLRDYAGYRFGRVTADQFASESPLQTLTLGGFEVKVLSLDRSKSPYYNWRSAVQEHRLRLFRQDELMMEAENLLDLPDKIDHPPDGCFVSNTLIKTLNGVDTPIKELVGQGPVWIYANDGRGNVVPAQATARFTKTVERIARVTLDNGQVIECTLDHRFMLRTGLYQQAIKLKPGDSLMPLYVKHRTIKYSKGGSGQYESVKSGGKWIPTHLLVADYFDFYPRPGEVIHHYDLDPKNNCPENLKRLTRQEHSKVHRHLAKMASDPEVVKRRVNTFKLRYSGNKQYKQKKSESAKKAHKKMTKATRQRWIDRLSESHKGQTPSPLAGILGAQSWIKWNKSDEARKTSSVRMTKLNKSGILKTPEWINRQRKNLKLALAKRMESEDQAAMQKLAAAGITCPYKAKKQFGGGLKSWKRRLAQYNHKVVSIEIVDRVEDVYDLEVPGYENFALAAGVFVHNSKDTCDSAAGAYENAIDHMAKSKTPVTGSSDVPTIELDSRADIDEKPLIALNVPKEMLVRDDNIFMA